MLGFVHNITTFQRIHSGFTIIELRIVFTDTLDCCRNYMVVIHMLCDAICISYPGGRRSPAVACWASNPLRGKFRH